MIKKVLIFVVIFFSAELFAQDDIGSGTFSIGGGISATTTFTQGDDEYSSSYNFYPEFYIFLLKNLAIGGSLGFDYYSHSDYNSIGYGIGPGIKFYLHPHRKVKVYFGTQYSYRYQEQSDYTSWYLSLIAGVDLFIAKNVAIEPYISLKRTQSDSKYYNYPWTFEIREGIKIAIFIF